MGLSFGTKYWMLFLILVVASSALVTLILYFRNINNRELTKFQLITLSFLRYSSVLLLAFMLLSPLLKTIKKITRKPLIILAYDNSQSMKTWSDSVKVVSALSGITQKLEKETEGTYEIVNYIFGERPVKDGQINLTDKKSNYSDLIDEIYNNHFNDNVGSLILVGDGNYNKGENPVNSVLKLGFPVYTLGIGDTTITRDARISNLIVNKIVFTGNFFPLEADLKLLKLKGIPLKFTVSRNGKVVHTEQIIPTSDDFFKTVSIILEAESPGLQHYLVQVETHPEERNTNNNKSEFAINVLANKQKIVFLSDGPHPDIGVIKNVLDDRQNYEVSVFTHEPYPSDYKDFNLIILNQVPGKGFTAGELLKKVMSSGIPVLFIIGNNSFIPQFNQLETGIQILPQAGANDEAQASVNHLFLNFNISEEVIENLLKFPPLNVPFAEYKTDPSVAVICFQRVKNIATNRPLIATGSLAGKKIGLIVGEGIWRWRLYDFYFNNDHRVFDEFISQFIQYLALKVNEDNFNLYFQNIYTEVDNVIISAELFNDAFEHVTSAEVSLEMTKQDGTSFNLTFDKLDQTYRLDAGILPVGDYNFTAKAVLGEKVFAESGSFAVIPINNESTENEADFKMLFQIASLTGGKFYTSESFDRAISDLKHNSKIKQVNYYQTTLNEMLNLKFLFFLAAFLLGAEWFLRKFWGLY